VLDHVDDEDQAVVLGDTDLCVAALGSECVVGRHDDGDPRSDLRALEAFGEALDRLVVQHEGGGAGSVVLALGDHLARGAVVDGEFELDLLPGGQADTGAREDLAALGGR